MDISLQKSAPIVGLLVVLLLVGAGCSYEEPKVQTPSGDQPAAQDTGDLLHNQPAATSTPETPVVSGEATNITTPPALLEGTSYTRKSGESVGAFAYRTLQDMPGDWKMAHEAVEVWAAGAPHSIVVAYQEEGMAAQGFHSYVLVSADLGNKVKYTKIDLPDTYKGEAYTQVQAVWSQWGGKKPYPDKLFILVSQMTGIGPGAAKPWYETYVYEWTGSNWQVNTQLSKELFNLYPAGKVKEKLNQLDY